ncbi:CD209 antigen-like protein C [Scomber scombrus]|uniref:CD209 antigen-like protein C n=1 Tax=Scomber scombrus TaxID=13677 RepID=A0AAV1N2B3_SCOSC
MESSVRSNEDDTEKETPGAITDAAPCRTCRRTTGVAVVMATVILVMALILSLVLFGRWASSSEMDQTSKTKHRRLRERLQQCQKKRSDLNLMLHNVTRDSRCNVCPDGWLWWRHHCYFFSVGLQENRQWNESGEFCQQHNSSLAVIKDSAEMEFITGVLQNFSRFPFLWVGLTDSKQEGQWLWSDGANLHHYMPVTMEWDADHRDCADLRGGGSLFAADCEEYGPWACKRES